MASFGVICQLLEVHMVSVIKLVRDMNFCSSSENRITYTGICMFYISCSTCKTFQ
jgi:hypothetical protein